MSIGYVVALGFLTFVYEGLAFAFLNDGRGRWALVCGIGAGVCMTLTLYGIFQQ